MRKLAVIGATLAVLGASAAAASVASAAPTSAAEPSVKVLHLISHDTYVKIVDIGKKGTSPGDELIETTIDFQHGVQVDRSVVNCVLITIIGRAMDVLCHGDLAFKDGQVQFQGETNFHTPFTLAVTGGTGAYQNAGGQLTLLRTLPNGNDVETLRLVFFETG